MRWVPLLILLAACSDGKSGISDPDPENTGELRLAVTRAANSVVPAQADSAVIRIWHPTAGTNILRRIAIPAPGDTTRVQMRAAARSGYSVGVMAYLGFDGSARDKRLAFVGGRTDSVTISASSPAQVHVTVNRWQIAFTVPDSVVPGEQTTIRGRITGGPNFFGGGSLCMAFAPWTSSVTTAGQRGCAAPLPQLTMVSVDSFTTTFTAPAASSDTTLWYSFDFFVATVPWQTGGLDYAFLPSLTLGDTLFRVPVRVSGDITVVFSRASALRSTP